jgi:hypothetical protein
VAQQKFSKNMNKEERHINLIRLLIAIGLAAVPAYTETTTISRTSNSPMPISSMSFKSGIVANETVDNTGLYQPIVSGGAAGATTGSSFITTHTETATTATMTFSSTTPVDLKSSPTPTPSDSVQMNAQLSGNGAAGGGDGATGSSVSDTTKLQQKSNTDGEKASNANIVNPASESSPPPLIVSEENILGFSSDSQSNTASGKISVYTILATIIFNLLLLSK